MSQPVENNSEVTGVTEGQDPATTNNEPSFNPAWNGVYDVIPGEFRERVRPTLEEWDRNFATRTAELNDYKNLGTLDDLKARQAEYSRMVESINSDPVAFGTRYLNALEANGYSIPGWVKAQAQAAEQQNNSQPPVEENSDDPLSVMKKQMEQQSQQFQAFMQQQQQQEQERMQQEQVRQNGVMIDNTMSQIAQEHKKQYPNIPFDTRMILTQASAILQQKPNASMDDIVKESYKEYVNFALQFTQGQGRVAPQVTNPSSGGMPPANAFDPSKSDKNSRYAAAMDIIARTRGQG